MPRAERHEKKAAGPHAFWSGTSSFGLVSIPVELFPANRPGRVALRMLAPDGTPLARRYCCPADGKDLDDDEIVRGYEVDDGKYVVVTDEELDAIAPEKSRDIDLREFVPARDIDPMYFERGYYLGPEESGAKAYRLLAEIMERTGRAGIATFVMHGKEYLVAIFAQRGILRAETMRFQDELRSPKDIGLPKDGKVSAQDVKRIEHAIEKRVTKELDPRGLEDEWADRVLALARKKLERGEDVVKATGKVPEEEEPSGDLIRALKQSLGGRRRGPLPARPPASARSAGGRLEERTKRELLAQARKLGIRTHAGMTKDELVRAIRRADRAA